MRMTTIRRTTIRRTQGSVSPVLCTPGSWNHFGVFCILYPLYFKITHIGLRAVGNMHTFSTKYRVKTVFFYPNFYAYIHKKEPIALESAKYTLPLTPLLWVHTPVNCQMHAHPSLQLCNRISSYSNFTVVKITNMYLFI